MFKSNKLSGVWAQFPFFFYWNIIQSEMQMFLMLPKAKTLGNFHTSNFLFDDL